MTGNVPVNGVQSVPPASCMSHAQLVGGRPGGISEAGSGLVSLSTNVDVEFCTVGLMPHKRVLLLFESVKHGSLMLFPTVHRHASARNGAAMEFVQQEPFSTGVELAGCTGAYTMICVAGPTTEFCVDVTWLDEGGFIVEGFENEKNWPTPKRTTNAKTTTTIILFVRFMLCVFALKELECADNILHQRIYFLLIERL